MVRIVLLKNCPAGMTDIQKLALTIIPTPHAHGMTSDPHFGTICVNPGEPIKSILHELAHIQAPDDAHGPVWQARMKAFGLDTKKWYFFVAKDE